MNVHRLVSLGGEIQHFTQGLSLLFRSGEDAPWDETNKYAQCAATGAVFDLLLCVWREGVRTQRPLLAGNDLLQDEQPVLHVWVPDDAAVAAASRLPSRPFFSRWETYSENGEAFLLVSASTESMRPFLPSEPLALTLLLHGLDDKAAL